MKPIQVQTNVYLNLDTVERITVHPTYVSLQIHGGNSYDIHDPYRDGVLKALSLTTTPSKTAPQPSRKTPPAP